ncbi:MAG: acetylxylan esterase [Maioricimonas sp. JB049]
MSRIIRSVLVTGLLLLSAGMLRAESDSTLRVFPAGQRPDDRRLEPLKDLNGYFPFDVPESAAAWDKRAEELRRRVLVANGLWPMPPRTPLNAVIHGKVERDGFTVERVYFESVPGFYVTGMLFRPSEGEGPFPGVLTPHGHGGRLQDAGSDKVQQQIERGEEKFAASGRFPKLARCAHLARMGCVTFIYDMIGYADNTQLSYELAHRFARQRPEMDDPRSWGLYSTQAELRMQSIFGLQTWNSIRALDFLCSLPDVDATRIGVTGGSGGGTQSIILCAIDRRPVVAFPQGMVSTAMQGGCTCENCSLLRVGTGNVELAALFAPRPQAMTAANDWTKEMMTKGYPQLQQLYRMLGHPEKVDCDAYLHFPHNYNYVTRAHMYEWFNQYLDLGFEEPIIEQDYKLLSLEEMAVWNDKHPAPEARGEEFERQLLAQMTEQSNAQIASLLPENQESFEQYREIIGGAFETIFGRTIEDVGTVDRENIAKIDRGDYWFFKDVLTVPTHDEQLPVVSVYPKSSEWSGRVVVWLTGQGKAGLFNDDGEPVAAVRTLLDRGDSVVTADLFGQGEFAGSTDEFAQNRKVENPREYAGYTYTYNDPLFTQRVHDVLSLLKWIDADDHGTGKVTLVGTGEAGLIVAAAAPFTGKAVDAVAVETNGFRFATLDSFRDRRFVPGVVKYGDLPALLGLAAPRELLVVGDTEVIPAAVATGYAATDRSRLTWADDANDAAARIIDWLARD